MIGDGRTSVSVVVPVHNGALYLREALESIAQQSYSVNEVVVVDDGSTDGSDEIARSFGGITHVVRQPNQGTGVSRNRGVSLSSGSLVAFLDQDDVWEPDKIERQVAVLDTHAEVAAVFCHVSHFHSPEASADFRDQFAADSTPMPGFLPSALLIRRATIDAIGTFDSSLILTEWFEWCLRLRDAGTAQVVLPEVLLRRRVHPANKGVTMRHARQEYARALHQSLRRRRG